ncbi:MAG: LysM peptidoglycan-binding domain-containing protein, partial [Treponema sp.]|nr:LysM peptidoglycan-binding domain-containing protein [Treponema sp.]
DLYDDEDVGRDEKKNRLPVVICMICAVICVLAVLLLLFIIPSKFNLINSKASEKVVQEQAATLAPPVQKEEPLPPPPEPVAPPAKEDEIVVVEEAEIVVPDLPKVEEKREPKVITYKIKWGDTLWDISAAYYKNPWRYKKIARYNGIKNPNHIVAGTYIKIPED